MTATIADHGTRISPSDYRIEVVAKEYRGTFLGLSVGRVRTRYFHRIVSNLNSQTLSVSETYEGGLQTANQTATRMGIAFGVPVEHVREELPK